MTSSRPRSALRTPSPTTPGATMSDSIHEELEPTSNGKDEPLYDPMNHAATVARAKTWAAVGIGTPVTLTKPEYYPFTGMVDNKTADGSVIWVISRTGLRKLFHIADGFELTTAQD